MNSADENKKEQLSNYGNNLILGDTTDKNYNDKQKLTTTTDNDKKNKKSKNKNKDEKEDDGKPKDDVKAVSFLAMFRYSTGTNKIMYIIGILGAIASGLTTPANLFIFGDLANAMIAYGEALLTGTITNQADVLMDAVQTFAVLNTVIGVVMLACTYFSVTLFNYSAQAQVLLIRGRFLKSILHQDMSWYDFNQSGEVASRMNEDLRKMEEGLGEKICMFINFTTAFIGSLVLAFVKGWQLALVCLTSLPATFIAMGLVSVATSRLAKQELSVYAAAGNIAEEAFSGIRTVKAFEGESKEVAAYRTQIVDARKLNIKRNFFSGLGFGLLWFFIYSSFALAFWYGVGLVLKNYAGDTYYDNYDPGTMMIVFFSVMMGSMNIGMASPYIEAFGIAKGACAKVFKLIEQVPTINPIQPTGRNLNEPVKHIEFKDIVFQYPTRSETTVLNKFNLQIHRGETVALVGSSGCGKSTCIQLIQRFYDPQGGDVYINGTNMKDINVNWLRERIGVVGQEPILFGTSIYENIRYGRQDATQKEIEEAARAANAHIFINKLPKKYQTLVGERGAQLSGGQKQRIAIARALIRDPEILLLDEATSALDTASESKVQAALEQASQGRTTVIVAHRLSTIRNADRIIVINKGEVIEFGNHHELMALKQNYYNLVMTQVGDESMLTTPGVEQTKKFLDNKDEEYIEVLDEIEAPKKEKMNKEDKFSLLTLLKANETEWKQLVTGSITSIIMGCAMPLFAVLFGDIMQVLAVRDDPDYVRNESNMYCLYFVIVGVVVGAATFLQIYTFGIAGEKLTERLRGNLIESMLKQEVAWFDDKSNGTGSLCARLSGDASAVQGATGQRIGTIIQSISTIVLAVGLSMYYEWSLGLLALAFTPFVLIAMYFEGKMMAQENMGTAKTMENSTKLAIEVVSNIRTVASLGREDMFHEQYMEMLYPAVALAQRNTHVRGFVFGFARSIMFFAYAACIYYGGWCIVNKGMDFGNVFKVSQALISGTASIAGAMAFAPNFQKGITAAENIFKLLRREPKIGDRPGVSQKEWNCEGNVLFDDVKFSYPTRQEIQVLRGLVLAVQRGQKIALVGPSGCGKSTCIQLLQRFYDVDEGSLSLDSQDVRNISLSNLRRQLGIVSQEPILFDRTIRDNIAYGDNTRIVSEQEIIAAAKKANIHNFVTNLPLGYETRMGEKGTQLSGGQKQRIAIARALVRNPKVLLLDEATSALDAESEKVVQDALEVASEGRTSISIAHRLSTIVDCDIIFVFDGGKVSESGTHRELLGQRGLYYTLYKLQVGVM